MEKKLQVRVTLLESFRRFISDDYPYETEEKVIDSLTKTFEGNDYTRIGTAFHSIVETGCPQCEKVPGGVRHYTYYGKEKSENIPEGRKFSYGNGDAVLDINQCKVALEYRNKYINAFHEIREYKDYGRAVVTGCADVIDGIEIRDIKTKYSPISDKDYIDSCQWRFYLDLFEANVFHFDLFEFKGYDKDKHKGDVRGLPLVPYSPSITCYRYPQMELDNAALLNEFIDWVEYRNLLNYIPTYNYD